ncbi:MULTISPECIES: dihydrodipicolinate synthase family protein [Pseudoxanthomonas]|jgi:dihydrodipicolinate synthase/N-acetylneuraminate lyase|uniref:dihydrodipicolinate synthase family protein n=1 Tax=Pseudoxanthomonas TaxID=83618 RepID=UPI001622EED7|nr:MULTISPECIES: dihydrodipicolinate synthase family protein [Pseudoxanthomonas]MBB3275853.1 4-hydroxy-tetrahydrodipicolinate synthase [Pseudoxanthomonas sp. OG2]MBD9379519.1 dihydrodipicolinate synthase family protein [Pseudoxanthomonas sp. PXM04]MBV7473064.1 dihydrodipicolinate synthase family protein [Pseudoxanthomonas sp. PXM05]
MNPSQFLRGVLPAITTPFTQDGSVDHAFLAEHARKLVDAGCTALVPLGSLGEAATLSFDEKIAIIRTLVAAVGDRAPIVPGIAALSTAEAVRLARAAKEAGAGGMMVLPVYVYTSDWHEASAHARAVLEAVDLPAIIYNNPIAYRTDITPSQIAELARDYPHVHAVKESSGDVRRFAAIKELTGDKLVLLVGMDDAIVEGLSMGAEGWIAGLVNAYPRESVRLFELARDGGYTAARELYEWFLPLLRLDTVAKFVQLIKLVQAQVGMGSEHVRAPRLPVEGAEREAALAVIRHAIAHPPRQS